MLEVEVKYRVENWNHLQVRLAELGATTAVPRADADHYFNAPDRDFARTDEAVRLRRIGAANYFTYKGPKREAATKTRTEVELRLADGDQAAELAVQFLTGLGYRPVAVVHKTRRVYHLACEGFDLEVCLDEVDSVGQFVELEIQATEEQFGAARAALLRTATEFGLTEQERRSYLQLLLDRSRDAADST